MKTTYKLVIIAVIAVFVINGAFLLSKLFTERNTESDKINVSIEAIYQNLGSSREFVYSGAVISTNRYHNATSFVLADGFIADMNGNIVSDPNQNIRVGSNIEIKYNESQPICSINVTFDNETKIIGYKNIQSLNNNTLFNKTLTHADNLCMSNSVVRHMIAWRIID